MLTHSCFILLILYILSRKIGDRIMAGHSSVPSRRDFLRASAKGGFALGGLFGLGADLRAAHEEARHLKIAGVREVASVCPYCAVGCGQLVHVGKDRITNKDKIINIEGNPESPISQGTLCPKGAATFQLVVNELRATKVWYREPGATEWDKTKMLGWAMDEIAKRVKQTRDAAGSFQETWTPPGQTAPKRVNHTLRIASLGGATMDNEWNYVQCKLMRALGVVFIENQARI
jgi:formate dehydrogenase major subunit